MSNYIWNNTYSLEFLSEDFYELNISTKDNVYEIVRKRKDDNEVESLSINISNHICMFVQLLDNLLGKISYNNSTINDTLNYKKVSEVFHFVKNQLYNCDYSLFLRIYSIYHTYNHRKNGYLDVNNLYTFILDIINKIENLNENNFLILPGGFYLQKEKMLVKILYIIHKKNNIYSFTVLNNSVYGIQYHPFKIDEVENLGVLLRDVTLCIRNINKIFLTNSLFWLCLYRLYIFPNPDNVDILYQVLLPYLNNSFLTNNWNLSNNKTIKVAQQADEKNIFDGMSGSSPTSNKKFYPSMNKISGEKNDVSNFDYYNDTFNKIGNLSNAKKFLNDSYNYSDNSNLNINNGTVGNFNNFIHSGNLINFDQASSRTKDFQNENKIYKNENSTHKKLDYFNSFDFDQNVNHQEWDNFEYNVNTMHNDSMSPHLYDERYSDKNVFSDGRGNKNTRSENDKYGGGIYVNIYKNKFTSFSMCLYYCIIHMLKVLNIQEEDIEVFKIFLYYSIILKLCDDLFVYDNAERNRQDKSNPRFNKIAKEDQGNYRSDKIDTFFDNMEYGSGSPVPSSPLFDSNNHLNGNYDQRGEGYVYTQNDCTISPNSTFGQNEMKKNVNKIDHTFFVFLDMSIRKLCVLFHLYFCKMKMGIYEKRKMIKNDILNEILKKVLFVKHMYSKMESKFYAHVALTSGGELIRNKDYKNSIKFPMNILLEEELYKNYRKIEIRKDVNIPISFYLSKRTIQCFNDLYIIIYQTNIVTNILINQKNYIKHCYLLAFSFISHVLNNILPSPKHFIYLSKFQKLKRSLQISLFNQIYHMNNNIYFISCSIVQNKQIVMYKIINCSMLLFLYDFLLRIPCDDVNSPFSVHYNGFSTGENNYFVYQRGRSRRTDKFGSGNSSFSNCSESICGRQYEGEIMKQGQNKGRNRKISRFQMMKQFSRNILENESYSSLDEYLHTGIGTEIKLSGYCIDISALECFSKYFLIINPKLNIMRSDIIEYFYKINEKKINKNSQLFLFEKSDDINTSEIEILENISLDLGLERKKNNIIEYYCGENALFRQLIPEFYHLRDMLFLFKSYMCPYIDKLPPVRNYKYDDINLKFTYKNKLNVTVFNRKIDICGYMCPPKNTKMNFFSFIYQFMQSNENKKNNCILTYSNPNMYTDTYIENELDVLYVNDLPFLHPSLDLRDVEILLQYLTVPYIRIPLILEFFCDKNRIKSFESFDIQQLILCILFEPYTFKNKYRTIEEDNFIPTKDRNIFATKYGLLINELIMNPKNVLCSIYSFLELFFSFDKENSNNGRVIMVFIIMICTYVNSYIGLIVETNREIRRNLCNIENILAKEGLVKGANNGKLSSSNTKKQKPDELKKTRQNKKKEKKKKKKKKLHLFNKLKKKLIKNELYCSDEVYVNLDTYYKKIKRKLEDEVIEILLKYSRLCIQKNDITTCCIYHGCILLIYKDIKFRELNRNNVKNLLSSIFFILTYYTFNAETNYADLKNIYGLGSLFVNTNDGLNNGAMEYTQMVKKNERGGLLEISTTIGSHLNDTFSLLIKTFSLCECDIFISIHKHRNMLLKYLERNEMERNIIFEHTIHICACVHENNKNEYSNNGRLNRYNSNIFLNFHSNQNIIRKWLPAHKFKHVGIYTIENVGHEKGKQSLKEKNEENNNNKWRRRRSKTITSNYFFTSTDSYGSTDSLGSSTSVGSSSTPGLSDESSSFMSSYDDEFTSTEDDEDVEDSEVNSQLSKKGLLDGVEIEQKNNAGDVGNIERKVEKSTFDQCLISINNSGEINKDNFECKSTLSMDQESRCIFGLKSEMNQNEEKNLSSKTKTKKKIEDIENELKYLKLKMKKKKKRKKKKKKKIKMMEKRRSKFLSHKNDNNMKDGMITNPLHDTESLHSNSINNILNFPSFFKNASKNVNNSSEKRKMRRQKAKAKAKRDSILSNNKYISYIKRIIKEKNILINLQLFTFSYKDNNIITLNENIKKFKNYRDVFFYNKYNYQTSDKSEKKKAHSSNRMKKNVKVLITQSYQNFCAFNIIGKKHNLEVWRNSKKINLKNLMSYPYDKSRIFYIKNNNLLGNMKFSNKKTDSASAENDNFENYNMTTFYNFLSSEVKTGVLYEQENNDVYVRIIWKYKINEIKKTDGDNSRSIRISAEDGKSKDNSIGVNDQYGTRKDKEFFELKSFNINYETQNIEGLFNFKYEENQYDSSLINSTEESSFSDTTNIISNECTQECNNNRDNAYNAYNSYNADNAEKELTKSVSSSSTGACISTSSTNDSIVEDGNISSYDLENELKYHNKGQMSGRIKNEIYEKTRDKNSMDRNSRGVGNLKSSVKNLDTRKEKEEKKKKKNKKENDTNVGKGSQENEEEYGLREIIYRKDMNCIYIYNIYFKLNRFIKKLYYCSDVKKIYFSTSINRCKNLFYHFENNNVRLCYYNSKETYDKYSVSISRNLYNNIHAQTYLNPEHLSTFLPNILLQYYSFWYNADGTVIGEIKSSKKNRKNRNSIIYIRLFEEDEEADDDDITSINRSDINPGSYDMISNEQKDKKNKCFNFMKNGLILPKREKKSSCGMRHYSIVQKLQIFNTPKNSSKITSLRVNNDYRAMTLINILSYENNEVFKDFYNILMKFDHITYLLIYSLNLPSLFGCTNNKTIDMTDVPISVDLIEIPRLNLTLRRDNVDIKMNSNEREENNENHGMCANTNITTSSNTTSKKNTCKYHFEELNMYLYNGSLQKYTYIYNVIKKMNNTVLLQNSKNDLFFLVSLLNKPFFLNIANLYKEFNKKNIHLCTLLEKHINVLLKNYMYVSIYYHNFNINMNVNKNVDMFNQNAETDTASNLQYIVLSIHSSKLFINFRNIYSCFFFIVYKYINKEHEQVIEYCNNLSICKNDIKEIKYLLNILNYCDSSIYADVDSCACRLKIFITLSKQIKIILQKKRHRMSSRKGTWNSDQYYNIFHYVKSLWNFDKSGPNDNNSSSDNEPYNTCIDNNNNSYFTTSRSGNKNKTISGNIISSRRDNRNGKRKNQLNDTRNHNSDTSSFFGASDNSSSCDSNYLSSEKENKKKELNAQEKIIDGEEDDDMNSKKKYMKKSMDMNKIKGGRRTDGSGKTGENQNYGSRKNNQDDENNTYYEDNSNMNIYIYWDIIKDMIFYINNLIYIKAKCKLTIDEEIFLYQNCNINIHKYKLIYNRYIILNSIIESKLTSDNCNPLFFYNILRKKQLENQAKMKKYQIQYRKKSKIDTLHPDKKLENHLGSASINVHMRNNYNATMMKCDPSMDSGINFENIKSNFESLKNCLNGKKEKETRGNNLLVSINVPKVESVKYINNIDENIFMNINLYDNIGNIINNMSYKKVDDKNNVEALNYLNTLINSLGIQNFFIIYNFFINNLNIKIVKGENTFLYANLLSRFLYFYNYNISHYSKIIYIFIFIINHQEIVNMLPKIDDQKMKKNYLNFFKTNDSVFNFFNDIFKFVQNFQKEKKKKIKKNILPLEVDNNITISISDVIKYRLIININVNDYMCEKRIIYPFDVKPNVHVGFELLNELCFTPFKKLYKYLRRVKRDCEPNISNNNIFPIEMNTQNSKTSNNNELTEWNGSNVLDHHEGRLNNITKKRKNMLNFDFEENNVSCQNTYSKTFIQNMKNDYKAYLDYERKKVEYEFIGFSAEEIKMTFSNIKKLKEYVNMFVNIKDILLEIFIGDNKLLECINEFIDDTGNILNNATNAMNGAEDQSREEGNVANKISLETENTPWNDDLVDIDMQSGHTQNGHAQNGHMQNGHMKGDDHDAADKDKTIIHFLYKFGVLGKAEKEINLKILISCFMSKYAYEYLTLINPNLKKENAKKFINVVLLYMLIMNRKIFLHECISNVINILNIFKVYNLKLKFLKQKEKNLKTVVSTDNKCTNENTGENDSKKKHSSKLLIKLINKQKKVINKAINTIQLGTKTLTQLTLTERHYFSMRNKSTHRKIAQKILDHNSDSSDVSTCYFSSDQNEEGHTLLPTRGIQKEERKEEHNINMNSSCAKLDPFLLHFGEENSVPDKKQKGNKRNNVESTNCYYTYDPRLLIFEYTNNLIIRKKQVKMIKKLKRDFIKKKKQYCYQIIMGGGKTTVLSPLYFLIFSNYFLVFNMCPQPLIHFTINTFRSRFSSIIKKNIYYFNFSRYDNITTDLYISLCSALENKYILVTSPTCIKSLFLKLINTIQELNNMKTFDVIKHKAKTHITDALTKFLGFQNDVNSINNTSSGGFRITSSATSGNLVKPGHVPAPSDYNTLKKQLDLSVRILDILNKSILLIDEIDNVLHPLKSELHWPYGINRDIDLVNVVRNFTDVFTNNPYLKFLYDGKNEDVDIRNVKIPVANRKDVSTSLLNHIRQLREEEQQHMNAQKLVHLRINSEDDEIRKKGEIQVTNYGIISSMNNCNVDIGRHDNKVRIKNGMGNNFNSTLSTQLYRKEEIAEYGVNGPHNVLRNMNSGFGGFDRNVTGKHGSVRVSNKIEETGSSYSYIDLTLFRYKLSWVLIDFFFYPVCKKLTIPMNIIFNTNTEYIDDLLNTFNKEIEKGVENHDISMIPHFHIINYKWYDNIIWIIARYVYYFILSYKIIGISQKVIESYLCIPLCIGYNDINVKNRCKENNFSTSTIRRLLNIRKVTNKNSCVDASNMKNEDLYVLSSDYHFKIFEQINELDYIICKILNLCRLYINGILPFVFSKINTVHYGILSADQINRCQMIMSKSRYFLAIPYIGKDTPSGMSEYTNVDVVVSLTILSYRYQGMRYFDFILSMKNILYNYSLEKDYEHVHSDSSDGESPTGNSSESESVGRNSSPSSYLESRIRSTFDESGEGSRDEVGCDELSSDEVSSDEVSSNEVSNDELNSDEEYRNGDSRKKCHFREKGNSYGSHNTSNATYSTMSNSESESCVQSNSLIKTEKSYIDEVSGKRNDVIKNHKGRKSHVKEKKKNKKKKKNDSESANRANRVKEESSQLNNAEVEKKRKSPQRSQRGKSKGWKSFSNLDSGKKKKKDKGRDGHNEVSRHPDESKQSPKQRKKELKNMYQLYREIIETSGAKIRKRKKDINNTNFFIYDNNIKRRRESNQKTKLGKKYVDNIDRIALNDKELLYDLYNLTKKNPLLISYFLLGIILNKYIKHTEKQLSSNSQDLTNNVLFKYVVGYSGTSNDILPEEIHKCKYEKRTIGSILNIINDPEIVNFIFLPSQIAPIDILRSLAFSKIKFNSLIDTGYLINNISPKKVAYYILQFLDYIDCCVYIDNGKHMCMLPLERRRRERRRSGRQSKNRDTSYVKDVTKHNLNAPRGNDHVMHSTKVKGDLTYVNEMYTSAFDGQKCNKNSKLINNKTRMHEQMEKKKKKKKKKKEVISRRATE